MGKIDNADSKIEKAIYDFLEKNSLPCNRNNKNDLVRQYLYNLKLMNCKEIAERDTTDSRQNIEEQQNMLCDGNKSIIIIEKLFKNELIKIYNKSNKRVDDFCKRVENMKNLKLEEGECYE